jgi:hypothetical protein
MKFLGEVYESVSRNLSKAVVEVQFRWWDEPYAAGSTTLHICSGMNTKPIRQVRIMSIVGIWCSNGVLLTKISLPPPTKGRLAKPEI